MSVTYSIIGSFLLKTILNPWWGARAATWRKLRNFRYTLPLCIGVCRYPHRVVEIIISTHSCRSNNVFWVWQLKTCVGVEVILLICCIDVTKTLRKCCIDVVEILMKCCIDVTKTLRKCCIDVVEILMECCIDVAKNLLCRAYIRICLNMVIWK